MKIAYITNCFGTQSHTFIRREIEQLEALDVDITLIGIRQDVNATDSIQSKTNYLYPFGPLKLLSSNLALAVRQPLHYIKGAIRSLTSSELSFKRRCKMLYHYMAAAVIAPHLKDIKVTQVHAHFMNVSASISMYAAYHCKLPFSITVHSAGTFGTPHILGVNQKLEEAHRLLMISHYNIGYFEQHAKCRDKSDVVRCGMDLQHFPFSPRPINRNQPLKLLAVGRFVEKKGFKYLIETFALAKKQGLAVTLEIIGDGPLHATLKQQAIDLKLDIEFLGQQPTSTVRESMTQCDIVIVPSVTSQSGEMEGLPVVIMEAMALGRIVIATEHAGIPEIVINNETGFLVKEKSPSDIIDTLTRIIQTPTELEITQSARNLVEKEFNIVTVANTRKRIFEKIESEQL